MQHVLWELVLSVISGAYRQWSTGLAGMFIVALVLVKGEKEEVSHECTVNEGCEFRFLLLHALQCIACPRKCPLLFSLIHSLIG